MCAFIRNLFGKSEQSSLSKGDIVAAANRIAGKIPGSPVSHSPSFSKYFGRKISIKWDSRLPTGSFKERGALNFLLQLSDSEKKRGVCAASAGNHALGLSTYATSLGIPCTIIMPKSASLIKVEANRSAGADVTLFGKTFNDAYEKALETAKEKNLTFVPAYDDERIIAGQGVSGLELLDQVPDLDTVIIPIGGGGYAAGVSIALKETRPNIRIIGVLSDWAEKAREGSHPVYNGVEIKSIADGIAVKKIGLKTQPFLEKYIDLIVSVSEISIARALLMFLEKERTVVEGSGAAPLAALCDGLSLGDAKSVALMCSGSNIDPSLLSTLIDWGMADSGRLVRIRVSLPDRPGSLNWITGIFAECGANIVQVFHDRSYAGAPGCVEIACVVEVRNKEHGEEVITKLKDLGVTVVIT